MVTSSQAPARHWGTTDGGINWFLQTNPVNERVYDVAFFGEDMGLVVGATGQILRTENSGATWTDMVSGPYSNFLGMASLGEDFATVVGEWGTIMRTEDAGTTWNIQNSGSFLDFYAVSFANPDVGIAVGDGGTVRQTDNGGLTWLPRSPGSVHDIYGVHMWDASLALAVGYFGRIIRTVDGGINWTAETSGVTSSLNGVCFLDGTTAIAVGDSGKILRSTNGGLTWNPVNSGTVNKLNAVTFLDATTGIIVGAFGTALRTEDAGITWSLQTAGNQHLYDAQFITADFLVAVGSSGRVMATNDGGATWLEEVTPTRADLHGVNITPAGIGTVAGLSGHIMTSPVEWVEEYSIDITAGYVGYLDLGPDIQVGIQGALTNGVMTAVYRNELLDLPAGYLALSPALYYDISTTVQFSVPLPLRFNYDPAQLAGPESELKMLHWDETANPPGFVDITDFVGEDSNHLYAITTSFSPFVVAESTGTSPVPSASPDAGPRLHPASPNPFNPRTTISFEIGTDGQVAVAVYDVAGRLVTTLADRVFPAGAHSLLWDGKDRLGREVVSGNYFARLQTSQAVRVQKMMLVR